jgi:hypothetical protein
LAAAEDDVGRAQPDVQGARECAAPDEVHAPVVRVLAPGDNRSNAAETWSMRACWRNRISLLPRGVN